MPEYMAPEQIELKAMGPWTEHRFPGSIARRNDHRFAGCLTGYSAIAVALQQICEPPERRIRDRTGAFPGGSRP